MNALRQNSAEKGVSLCDEDVLYAGVVCRDGCRHASRPAADHHQIVLRMFRARLALLVLFARFVLTVLLAFRMSRAQLVLCMPFARLVLTVPPACRASRSRFVLRVPSAPLAFRIFRVHFNLPFTSLLPFVLFKNSSGRRPVSRQTISRIREVQNAPWHRPMPVLSRFLKPLRLFGGIGERSARMISPSVTP